MIYEIVVFNIDPARRDEFVEIYGPAIRAAEFPGFRGGQICAALDDPSRVVVVNEWDSVEAHEVTRGTPSHRRFKAIIEAYWAGPVQLHHYTAKDI